MFRRSVLETEVQCLGSFSERIFVAKGDRCSPVPEVANSAVSTMITTNGTLVTFTCQPGHEMVAINATDATIQCVDGAWQGDVEDCAGKIRVQKGS